MKLKLTLFLGLTLFLSAISYSQSCPANWGMSTYKLAKYNLDLDKVCNEYPKEGKVIKEALNSGSNSGSGAGYQWEKKNGKLTIMWDKAKYSASKFGNLIKKIFGK